MGSDIVDRGHREARGRACDIRFLRRVFSEEEQATIVDADDPDGMLLALWAAKESAYKIESAILEPQVFAHRLYACRIVTRQAGTGGLPKRIVVACPDRSRRTADASVKAILRVEADEYCIHAHGFATHGDGACRQALPCLFLAGRRRLAQSNQAAGVFSKAERRSIKSRSSAEVRSAAKEALAACLHLDVGRLEIIRPTLAKRPQPPYLLLDGARSEISVSLSHHGEWISWCLGGSGRAALRKRNPHHLLHRAELC